MRRLNAGDAFGHLRCSTPHRNRWSESRPVLHWAAQRDQKNPIQIYTDQQFTGASLPNGSEVVNSQ